MQKNKVTFSTIKRLWKVIAGQYRITLIFAFISIIVTALAGVIGNMFIQKLVDDYITPLLTVPNPNFAGLLKAVITMAIIYAVGLLANFFYSITMSIISQGTLKKIRDDMFSHMQTLPIPFFDAHNHGDVMSYYTNDTDTLRDMISMSLPQMIFSVVSIGAVAYAMLSLSIWLSLVVFVCVAIMLIVVKQIGSKSAKYFINQQQSIADINSYIEEMINGQKVIKVFCHEAAAIKDFDIKNDTLRKNATNANRLSNIIMPVVMNIGTLQYVLLAIVGGAMYLAGFGNITVGTIAAFLTLSKGFSAPVGQISGQVNAVIMALAGAKRIFSLLDQQSEVDDGYVDLVSATREPNGNFTETKENTGLWVWRYPHQDGSITYTELKGDVRLFDVDFGYTEEKNVLHNISLYAHPGQKIAFVGATGAGKTTITNLLNRFYDIADGKIRFDDININKIKKSALRRSLGIVLQETNLFTGTVAENIRFGKLDATDEEVINAAKTANAHDFIMRLPNGYDTLISGDGSSLSSGQRQLLSIARAAVANPPIMILDEATSNIDTRTEKLVQKGMDRLMKNRTVFVIAHRLSTIKNSDAIMVMDQGKIIERGNHEDLLAQKGRYFNLYQ